jgi:hypothetical protein
MSASVYTFVEAEECVQVPELWWLLRPWTGPSRRALRQGKQLLDQGDQLSVT